MRCRCSNILWLMVLFALQAVPTWAQDYGYPFKDPVQATILATPPEYMPELPKRLKAEKVRSITVFPDRKVPDIFWYNSRLHYSVAMQDEKAPMMILIAGTGAHHNSSKMVLLKKVFFQAGYHVLAVTSPTHPNFIVAASSTCLPGQSRRDAADILHAVKVILDDLDAWDQIDGFYMTGYSLGGANAAFAAMLDEKARVFNFKKVLMINPPVDLYASALILDRMLEDNIPGGLDHFNDFYNRLMTRFAEAYLVGDFIDLSQEFFYRAYSQIIPDPSEGKAVIGLAFRISLGNMLFTSDVMTNSGYIVPKNLHLSRTDSLTDYAKVVFRTKGFCEYAKELLYPAVKAREPGLSFDAFKERNSLHAIEGFLRASRKIGAVTNADDFILTERDFAFLRHVLGSRLKIYPFGGHCGNMGYRDNVAYMIEFFKK